MITIVGNGAIGNLLAARCEVLAQDYKLLARTKITTKIQVSGLLDCQQITPKLLEPDEAIDSGILILPLKAYQVVPCLQQIKAQIGKQVTIVLMHNGMGTHQQVTELLPEHSICAATTSYGAYKADAAHLNVTGIGNTHCGWLNKPSMIKQHHRWIESLLPPCTWHTNIVAALWQKLAINAVINPLTAINNIYNGELTEPHYRQQIQNLSEEISVVMTALGIPISATSVLNNCLQVAKATAANYSSMHQDIANRRRTEIDFINGHVVSEGARLGVSVTHHQLIWRQIKKMEAQPPFNHD